MPSSPLLCGLERIVTQKYSMKSVLTMDNIIKGHLACNFKNALQKLKYDSEFVRDSTRTHRKTISHSLQSVSEIPNQQHFQTQNYIEL